MKTYLAGYPCSLVMVHAALTGAASTAVVEQRTRSFTLDVNGPIANVTLLFGPIREAEWSPGWSPWFIHPEHRTQGTGAVFTTKRGCGEDRLWLLKKYDVGNGGVEYAVAIPGVTATKIKINVILTASNAVE